MSGSHTRNRILIAKHDCISAEVIRHAAGTTGLIAESSIVHSAKLALKTLRDRPVDLCIIGLSFSEMDGVDLVSRIKNERLANRILVVSSRCDELVRAQLRPGRVDGFFNPELDNPAHLTVAIREVLSDGIYFTPAILVKRVGQTVDQLFTTHQMRILATLCSIGDEQAAANYLGLSKHTLHGHAQRLKQKLGVNKLSELIIEAIRRGVIRVTPDAILRPGFDDVSA